MKKLNFLLSATVFISYLFGVTSVNALQTMETQQHNAQILKEQGSPELIKLYNDQNFIMNDEWFDENGDLGQIEVLDVKYIETSTYISSKGSNHDIHIERNLTEEEYNNWKPVQTKSSCSGGLDCWETNAKRLTLLYRIYPKDSGEEVLILVNQWKTMPSVRSFDTIGMTFSGWTMTRAKGYQAYNLKDTPSITRNIEYSYKGQNMKISTTGTQGVSVSQNILDDAYSFLQNELYIYGKREQNMQITGSYQHAVKYIEFETSKDFTFDVWGMGHVFKWNAPTSNWDNMQGVCANWDESTHLWVC